MTKQVSVDITVTKYGEVAVLKMSGTDNRINIEFCRKWNEALDKVESWPDVKAMISTGSGKFYSNGLDLNFLGACTKQELDEYTTAFEKLRERTLCFPMVTIAAINGHCFAGGLIVALLHDYRVMQTGKGWVCLNEVDLGLRFADSMRALFKLKLSGRIMRDAALFGNRFTAVQALDIGLIDDIADEGEAVSKALEMALAKTKNRNFGREILKDMKMDIYREILITSDRFPGGVGQKFVESKL